MKYNKMKSGGMYDAIMKYMEGGNMRMLAEGGKPDYLDLDDDGNKEELMREAAKQMREGGRVYKFGGKMYEHGGEHVDPTGKGGSKKFRIIPTKGEGGIDELSYYIDGEPVDSDSFKNSYYEAGNKPENLQDLIKNSYQGQINAGGTSQLARDYRKGLEERDVYSKSGRPGIDSLYNDRTARFVEMMRRRGGVEGRDY